MISVIQATDRTAPNVVSNGLGNIDSLLMPGKHVVMEFSYRNSWSMLLTLLDRSNGYYDLLHYIKSKPIVLIKLENKAD